MAIVPRTADALCLRRPLWRTLALAPRSVSGVLFALIVGHLSYQKWKRLLRKDCIAQDKLSAFNTLNEIVLGILHENGIEPTVDALVNKGLPGPKKSETPVGD